MNFEVIIKAEAHLDVWVAYEYYEEKQPGLGELFLEALDDVYRSIANHPTHYSYIAEDPSNVFRDRRLKKFPYVVVFEIIGDAVIVYAVFHVRRDPAKKI